MQSGEASKGRLNKRVYNSAWVAQGVLLPEDSHDMQIKYFISLVINILVTLYNILTVLWYGRCQENYAFILVTF